MRGMLAGQAPQPSRMGLAGMRAPSSSKPLTMPGTPLVKPIKSPLGPNSAPTLVQPIQPKVVRTPMQPAGQLVQPNVTPEIDDVPLPASEVETPIIEESVPESTAELEAAVAQEIDAVQTIVDEPAAADEETAVMRPITTVLTAAGEPETVKTALLTPVPKQLVPKKSRGAPPNISREKAKAETVDEEKASTTTLTPLRRMTPLKINKAEEDKDEDE